MSILEDFQNFLSEYSLPLMAGGQAASVYLKNKNAKRGESERNALIEAERARQAEASGRSRAAFAGVMPQFEPQAVEGRRAAEEQRLRTSLAPGTEPSGVAANYAATVQQNQPQAAGDDLTSKVASALSEARANAQRLALARSFGSARVSDNRTVDAAGREVSRAGRDAQASAGLLPLELQATQARTNQRNRFPDALGVTTGIAGLYGASRNKKPATPWWGTQDRNF